jgi:energy-coupling factor transporter ATP-binding protein EcfA2
MKYASLSSFSTGPSSTGGRLKQFASVVISTARSFWGGMAAVATIVTGFAALTLQWRSTVETSESKRTRLEVEALLAARAPPSAADKLHVYVQRAELEDTLESFLREPITDAGSYMVVVGQRGAGKSTLVTHVLSKMGKGTLVVPIDEQSVTASDLKALVLREALTQDAPQTSSPYATSTPVEGNQLAKRLEAAAKARGEEGWRPTLVFEITQSGDGALIRSACALLKLLTHDQPLCHGLLVLSSSFAVAELPDDGGRQRFLRVGAFSRSEASAKLNANLKAYLPEGVATVAAVQTVNERILPLTTLPKYLGAFTGEMSGSTSEADFLARAEAWADKFQATARMDVEGAAEINVFNTFLGDQTGKSPLFTTRDLMRELLETGAPVKLPNTRFNVPSNMFATKIRQSQEAKAVFNVDLVSKTVDFASGAHRMAAAELLPSPPPAS